MDMNQYMGMFLDESREHLQSLNSCLLELESDPANLSVLDEIFRSAHTLKGMSATMGFNVIAELTHDMENILDLLRKSELKASPEIIDTLFQCVDTLEQLVEGIATGTELQIDTAPLINKLNALAKGEKPAVSDKASKSPDAEGKKENIATEQETFDIELNDTDRKVLQEAENQGMQGYGIQVVLSEGCLLKSARAYMVMSALDDLGEVIKSEPAIDQLEQEKFDLAFEVILLSDAKVEKVQQRLLSISEVEQVNIVICESGLSPLAALNIENSQGKEQAAATLANTKADSQVHPVKTADKKHKASQTVRVDIEKLDNLLNLVGELVINKTRLEQIGQTQRLPDLGETIEMMDRITTDLQAVVMKVRMVPVGQVFNRFPRMVRDLSHELNKEVNLIIQGEETELDRTVIDEIGDPLVHLLRNSIDHGVESAEERQAKGKNPIGEIKLIARHEGNNVIIEVVDDGAGIDADKIKRKAVEKGLLSQPEADKMDNSEAVKIVFFPGFSTAETITDVSGRGVGMDAVKTKIESLGGLVDVETKINKGTTFRIKLPLTLAIIQALLVKVYEEIYAIPLGSIDSTINIKPEDIKTIQNQEVIMLRGQIIPIVRLDNVLAVPKSGNREQSQDELYVVIVHMGDQRAGIIVDTLIGQQEIVIKSLGKLLSGIKVIAGATILGNGQVALILDVGALM